MLRAAFEDKQTAQVNFRPYAVKDAPKGADGERSAAAPRIAQATQTDVRWATPADPAALEAFVHRVAPLIDAALVENAEHAEHAQNTGPEAPADPADAAGFVAALPLPPRQNNEQHAVAQCAWSSGGAKLAAALCPAQDAARGLVVTWTLDDGPDADVLPPATVWGYPAGRVTALQFHPASDSVLAAGTDSGEIVVWDCSGGDPGVTAPRELRSTLGQASHLDAIVGLVWVQSPVTRAWELVSAGRDGRVLAWDPLASGAALQQPVASTQLLVKHLPKTGITARSDAFAVGIGALAVAPGSSTGELIVGTESGHVLTLRRDRFDRVDGRPGMGAVTGALSLYGSDARQMAAEPPLLTPVCSLAFAPFDAGVLAVGGADGTVRLVRWPQSLSQNDQPVLAVLAPADSLLCATWSAAKPTALFVCASGAPGAQLLVYDFEQQERAPVAALAASAGASGDAEPRLTTLAVSTGVSAAVRGFVAVGDESGHVRVWRPPSACLQASDPGRLARTLRQRLMV